MPNKPSALPNSISQQNYTATPKQDRITQRKKHQNRHKNINKLLNNFPQTIRFQSHNNQKLNPTHTNSTDPQNKSEYFRKTRNSKTKNQRNNTNKKHNRAQKL